MVKKWTQGELKALYEGQYAETFFDEDRGRIQQLIPLMDLRSDMVVADFGCANAMLLDYVRGRVRHYYGVDFSETFVRRATERHPDAGAIGASFHAATVEAFCADHPVELNRAFLLDVTEHVYDEDLLEMLRAIRGSLRPDGSLYVHTPNLAFVLERFKQWGVYPQHEEHIAVRDAAHYRSLLSQAGFSRVVVSHLPHYLRALSWLQYLSPLPGVGSLFRARLFIECRP